MVLLLNFAAMSTAAFVEFRNSLAPSDRSVLDALAAKLLAVNRVRQAPRPDLEWPIWIREAGPFLTTAECGVLAVYAIGAIGAGAILTGVANPGPGDGLLEATRQMQETQMSFNLQYLQLQSEMQNENRQFTMVSNIMKTKHDTVKNTISNIR